MKTQFVIRHKYQELFYDGLSHWGGIINIARNVDLQDEFIFDSISDAEPTLEIISKTSFQYEIIEYVPKLKPKRQYEPYYNNVPTFNTGSANEFCSECGSNILAKERYLEWYRKPICLHCIMNKLEGILGVYDKLDDNLKDEWTEAGSERFDKFARKLKR